MTTTRLTFGNFTSEFMTTATIAFLMGHTKQSIESVARRERLIMREKNGQRWVEIFDALKLVNLLSA